MKIRIKGNAVRYRLTKSEVETFCQTGRYEEKTAFQSNTLTYVLETKAGISELEADFKEDSIVLYLPEEVRANWATSDRVGYSNSVDWNDESKLSLLVEKDFTCLDNTIEDQSDNYPNPRLAQDEN
ncbi:DUF7009 family protein [Poritiphilus flavus]|uniref:Uncharacterized protein n=1 Tax=Poritiphilus flavus TaxID=2697053 RepID=A0A6L9E769_9FLAO|nr:hypothetical protein [Poritiphilus flavus]NAS10567.1 hypothetical protein [Poritiphilus flavus]